MNVLITGGTGQLGQCLITKLTNAHHVIAPTRQEMDLTYAERTSNYILRHKPNVIIHSAAYSRVDQAESERDECYRVNVCGTKFVAQAAQECGAYLIYISTDYVFDGRKSEAYQPEDQKSPLSVYGQTKSAGEDIVLGYSNLNLVVRTAWMYGPSSQNFVEAILRAAKYHTTIQVVSDQIGNPTYAEDLAEFLGGILYRKPAGIIHAVNEGFCTRAELAMEILGLASIQCKVEKISSAQYPTPAQRPNNSRLSTQCLKQRGLGCLPPWQDGLRRYMDQRKEIQNGIRKKT